MTAEMMGVAGKADIGFVHCNSRLPTQSGHSESVWTGVRILYTFPDGIVVLKGRYRPIAVVHGLLMIISSISAVQRCQTSYPYGRKSLQYT